MSAHVLLNSLNDMKFAKHLSFFCNKLKKCNLLEHECLDSIYHKKVCIFLYFYFIQASRVHNFKIHFLISQLKHMLWVLKGTVSIRPFF